MQATNLGCQNQAGTEMYISGKCYSRWQKMGHWHLKVHFNSESCLSKAQQSSKKQENLIRNRVLNCHLISTLHHVSECWTIFSQMKRLEVTVVILQKGTENTMDGACEQWRSFIGKWQQKGYFYLESERVEISGTQWGKRAWRIHHSEDILKAKRKQLVTCGNGWQNRIIKRQTLLGTIKNRKLWRAIINHVLKWQDT